MGGLHQKMFNINNIVPGPTPCEIFELWKTPDYHLKMKDRVLKIGDHFNEKFLLRSEQEGECATFIDAEIYGNKTVTERKEALKTQVEDRRSQEAARELDQQEKNRAKDGLNLVSPGRGARSPGGVALDGENDINALAALGQQPSSDPNCESMRSLYTRFKKMHDIKVHAVLSPNGTSTILGADMSN